MGGETEREQTAGSMELTAGSMELRALRCLIQVVREGQITRAAEHMQMTQPALSRTIARLERAVGVQLLERSRRGVALTPAGEAFFEGAQRCVRAADDALSSVGPWLRPPEELVFGFDTPSLQHLARPLIHELVAHRPETDVSMQMVAPDRRLLALQAGDVDVEIMFGPPEGEGLTFTCVHRARRVVLLAASHPLAGEAALSFAQIERERVPGVHPGVPAASARMWRMDELRREPARVAAETPVSTEELWALIVTGRVLAPVPEFIAGEIAHHGVRAIPLVGVPDMKVLLARRSGDARPLVLALFEIAERSGAGADPRAEGMLVTAGADGGARSG